MNSGHAICTVRSDNREIRHSNLAGCAFLDQTHSTSGVIAREATSCQIEKASINLTNDFQMSWQHNLEPVDWPLLQSFRQQGMIRVGQSSLSNIPSSVPSNL